MVYDCGRSPEGRTLAILRIACGPCGAIPGPPLAIFHFSVKSVSRSDGRSATAAAAYRAGVRIVDERTGEIHDYRRKRGIEDRFIVTRDDVPAELRDRAVLWNTAEAAENRKNSQVAREYEVALPAELDLEQRRELCREFAQVLVERFGVAVDVAMHKPGKDGDLRNYHAHIMTTTRVVDAAGFGAKTRELDVKGTASQHVAELRQEFAAISNRALERAGRQERISQLSLKAQGIEREATVHLGPTASAMERKGKATRIQRDAQERIGDAQTRAARAAQERLALRELGQAERAARQEAAAAAGELDGLSDIAAEQAHEAQRLREIDELQRLADERLVRLEAERQGAERAAQEEAARQAQAELQAEREAQELKARQAEEQRIRPGAPIPAPAAPVAKPAPAPAPAERAWTEGDLAERLALERVRVRRQQARVDELAKGVVTPEQAIKELAIELRTLAMREESKLSEIIKREREGAAKYEREHQRPIIGGLGREARAELERREQEIQSLEQAAQMVRRILMHGIDAPDFASSREQRVQAMIDRLWGGKTPQERSDAREALATARSALVRHQRILSDLERGAEGAAWRSLASGRPDVERRLMERAAQLDARQQRELEERQRQPQAQAQAQAQPQTEVEDLEIISMQRRGRQAQPQGPYDDLEIVRMPRRGRQDPDEEEDLQRGPTMRP